MFTGSCVALVTPMTDEGQLDEKALTDLVDWHLSAKTDAIVISGTTGESPTLTDAELARLTEIVVERVDHKKPVILGTGTNSTAKVMTNNEKAEKLGVDGVLCITPYYNKPMQNGLLAHFSAIAQNTSLPVILYNHPARAGCDIAPDTVIELSQIPNIVGIKEGNSDLQRLNICLPDCPENFKFYSGDDGTALSFLKQGGHGVISVAANVVPDKMGQLCEYVFKSQNDEADLLNNELSELFHQLTLETNPIPVKWALHLMGRVQKGIRLPLTPLTEQHQKTLKTTLETLGVFNG